MAIPFTGHLHYHDVSVLVLEEGLDLGTEFVRPVHLPTVEDVERLKGGARGGRAARLSGGDRLGSS